MPRLTNNDYYQRHRILDAIWIKWNVAYSVLSPTAQLEIHRFFLPTAIIRKHELLSYRSYIGQMEPSLPHRAGKHFANLWEAFRVAYTYAKDDDLRFRRAISYMSRHGVVIPGVARKAHVTSIVHPGPDSKLLARAFLGVAEAMQAEKNVNRGEGEAA